jgi:hypothetical protein
MRNARLRRGVLLVAAVLGVCPGCANRAAITGPETGTITVGVTTSGSAIESLRFRVDISPGGTGGPIKADVGVFTARNIPAGEHVVRLTDAPSRCAVDGGPERKVTVSEQRSATVRFVVKCT